MMNNKELAIKLASCEKENEIIEILKNEGYWDNYDYWRPFGDNDNNFSTIGNQQSKADAALVEKLINSVDAVLLKECLSRKIEMTSNEAPQSMPEALSKFFNIRSGQLSYLDKSSRTSLAENIIVAATGAPRELNLTIVDRGEGQTPHSMPDTILSVSKNNKLRVPFVQGKFNMGGTGVLPFCGDNRFQLVISKRCPMISNDNNDPTFDEWSVTIVRRESAREGRRSSMYTYLTDINKNLLSFKSEKMPIIPVPQSDSNEEMEYGTFIKLFNYALQSYKTNILFNFYYRMSMLMPELALPIRLRECRRQYSGHTLETTMSGLQTRLDEDRQDNIEEGFPSSDSFNIDGQNLRCRIYVFKKGRSDNYREKDGILYTVNGQTHATTSDAFFNKANLSYLADSLLVLVDCSSIDIDHREDMFMNSRDRLRNGPFVKSIEDRLKDILKNHEGLKKLQNERRAMAVKEKLDDDKPLQDVLQDILKKSPVLSKIFLLGSDLKNPFSLNNSVGEKNEFKGKKHPTFFTLKNKNKEKEFLKSVPINHDFRVQFETDAVNDYFARPDEQGYLQLCVDGVECPEMIKHLGLFNGVATLTINTTNKYAVGNVVNFEVSIIDDYIAQSFTSSFAVIMEQERDNQEGAGGKRVNPKDPEKKGNKNSPSQMSLPHIEEVEQKDWAQHNMDKDSALIVYQTEEGSDYYLNMDNQYLLTELKGVKDSNKIQLTKARYKYSMALIGMSIQSFYKNKADDNGDDNFVDEVKKITKMLSPILIPMLESMAELEIDN